MKTHILKSWPQFFQPILEGTRTHELRRDDRSFSLGDRIQLKEFDPESKCYTGRSCTVEIRSMTSAAQPCAVSSLALHPDFCILSVRLVDDK